MNPLSKSATVLLDAFDESNLEVSRQVLEAGADANVEDEGGISLHYAALLNHAEMAGRLIPLGANVNAEPKPPK